MSPLVNRDAMYQLASYVFQSGNLDLWLPERELVALALEMDLRNQDMPMNPLDLIGMFRCCFLDQSHILVGQYEIEHQRKAGIRPTSPQENFYRFNLDAWNLMVLEERLEKIGLKIR